jgi:hypothetical protein
MRFDIAARAPGLLQACSGSDRGGFLCYRVLTLYGRLLWPHLGRSGSLWVSCVFLNVVWWRACPTGRGFPV